MTEFVTGSSFFAVALTLVAFALASRLQGRWKLAILNPILLSALAVIGVLKLLDVPNEIYQSGCRMLNFLLTPATICLAVSFYEQFRNLKQHMASLVVGTLAGTVTSIGSIWLLCRVLHLDRALTLSLLPKSVTTAIGAPLSAEIGGIAAITTAAIIVTGIVGSVIGPACCKLFRLSSPVAQGVAFGTSSHVVGTSRAVQMSQLAGAVSSFALTVAGITTCILLSVLAELV